ncbi:MAG: Glycosyl transferase family 2 [Candidatus Nomurabacteria bacterium GW2011_GWE1_32_28]|uniref:Glycosyl transferase family 2 n=1 Tax=Candidatus Nomurabacteria bacterium GW2011_GWF1_31_48 TaxID=1618767 RepID=A0A0F9YFN5_9BACT|nr:MAG: Glycosyl transferase family 2 [Candidatus Nomurabacteria bacterium GW2011_GWF2_30_133]KKP28607.1 MAG: Glycosyl transferase family 2 [Candidatus Nomurabacteria bacterium GW2011_GWE2_31_40]KKP30183.1 MAG: Glycosyl transferase family 2 [Candidatus Nomurabacteria bacterium GW2011_GWF1_31_48]KKP34709.1 MAG: Glycosyl transferase family 2 [Candidatus Nomurabacteria bacterium GW2011_GWE1_32_28]
MIKPHLDLNLGGVCVFCQNVILYQYNMALFLSSIFYIFSFLSVYVQVFFLITFLDNKKEITNRNGSTKLYKYPKVTIMVPAWNEENTIYKTVRSLLNLNYPKNKIQIFLIDDGSTDKTWDFMQKFSKFSNIKIFHKDNGGKHTALNVGLENLETDYVGCLDADSIADPESLVRIMSYFEKDSSVMAVSPSILVINSKNIIQHAQKAEYDMSIYVKKMLSFLGAIHVTPGPLTIFNRKVFDDLGPYRHAHNTEDMEIAYRMQKNNYKIKQCNDAYVYTNTPGTIKKLYKQRLRWIYGFINNTIDYRSMIFKKKYGNFSLFSLPFNIMSVVAVTFIFGKTVYSFGKFLFLKVLEFKDVGFNFNYNISHFDPFFINTQSLSFIGILLFLLIIFSIMIGKKMSEGKWNLSFNMILYILIFSIVGPFWLLKAIFNTILSRKPAWR